MEFKGSKTEANLHTAFAGESEARNKYTYYAGIAKKEGYNQIASILKKLQVTRKSMLRSGSKFNERRYSACQPARYYG